MDAETRHHLQTFTAVLTAYNDDPLSCAPILRGMTGNEMVGFIGAALGFASGVSGDLEQALGYEPGTLLRRFGAQLAVDELTDGQSEV